ncbi:unnamed protein product [Soboliphyme baturini]|uniref:Tetratricopeptide repeat protein 38 n=1 Tax=Soboliphyme baturini TaxID=241478 RepID=A0A183J136_9BILA|nr:unnamed protein product [Soboliphyme baturini]
MLLTHRWSNPMLKPDFESGVRLGIGTFNLLLSALPSRVLKLLEFVGFQGDRKFGLQQLHMTVKMRGSLRHPLAILVCLAWNLIFNAVLGLGDVNLQECSNLLRMLLTDFPTSSLGLFFAGKYAEAKGDIHQAFDMFSKSIQNQSEWRPFHHPCFWELMFCHAFSGQWEEAAKYANLLFVENRWSKSSYAYLTACFLLAHEATGSSTVSIREKITQLMK